MTELSKENDKWLDDSSEFYESGSTGGDWCIPQDVVEAKLLELEAEIAKRDELLRVAQCPHPECFAGIVTVLLSHDSAGNEVCGHSKCQWCFERKALTHKEQDDE